jgi:hypothetical protein
MPNSPKMDSRIKELWVSNLRSGEYKQGKLQLKKTQNGETSYCCLGVLEDLRCKEEGVPFNYEHYAVLSYKTVNWAGLDNSDPSIQDNRLTELNDGAGRVRRSLSFLEIADLIEREL